MTEVMHADIFFFITAIAVVILSVGLAAALYYVVIILRDLREITRKVRAAGDGLEKDFDDLRAGVRHEGVRVRTVFELALGFITRFFTKTRAKKKTKRIASDKS